MSTPLPPDPQDLDLVAALAAGELDGTNAMKAQALIADDIRLSEEHEAQLIAINALGADDWYEPLTDLEKFSLRKAVVPKDEKPSWALRSLGPLSVAAALVVLVGFVGMQFAGGANDQAMDPTEAASVTEAPATESFDVQSAADAATKVVEESLNEAEIDMATSPELAILDDPALRAPEKGILVGIDLGEVEVLQALVAFPMWTDPVPLDRYRPLSCWAGEIGIATVGVATATVNGVAYEVVAGPLVVEARVVGTCEPVFLDR